MSRVLILAPAFSPAIRAGGPVRALTNLADDIKSSTLVDVVTADRDLGDAGPFPGLRSPAQIDPNLIVHYVDPSHLRLLLQTMHALSRQHYDVVLLNSIWNVPFAFLPALLAALGRFGDATVVLMPRGQLEDGALALDGRKKAWAMPLVRLLYGRAADFTGATSESEAANLTKWLPRLPVLMTADSPDRFTYGQPEHPRRTFRLAFLARIHPTKGLLELIRALRWVGADIELDIAGPIGDAVYWDSCRAEIAAADLGSTCRYLGALQRDAVEHFLHEHDAFVSLTAGENFGHSYAEAMQSGCPVISTDRTPWTETIEAGGGWIVDDRDDARGVAQVLSDAASLSGDERLRRRSATRSAYDAWAATRPKNIVDQVLEWRAESHWGSQESPARQR